MAKRHEQKIQGPFLIVGLYDLCHWYIGKQLITGWNVHFSLRDEEVSDFNSYFFATNSQDCQTE